MCVCVCFSELFYRRKIINFTTLGAQRIVLFDGNYVGFFFFFFFLLPDHYVISVIRILLTLLVKEMQIDLHYLNYLLRRRHWGDWLWVRLPLHSKLGSFLFLLSSSCMFWYSIYTSWTQLHLKFMLLFYIIDLWYSKSLIHASSNLIID